MKSYAYAEFHHGCGWTLERGLTKKEAFDCLKEGGGHCRDIFIEVDMDLNAKKLPDDIEDRRNAQEIQGNYNVITGEIQ